MELIHKDDWKKLASHVLDPKATELPPTGSVVYTETEHLYDFLKLLDDDHRYVLLTANSDYSLVHQNRNPVWADMQKWLSGFVSVDEDTGYNPVIIPTRCSLKNCKLDDAISIKMYSYTGWTMRYEDISDYSLYSWYATNSCIQHSLRGDNIPFGIPDWTYEKIQAKRKLGFHQNKNRKIPFFFSCSFNTGERFALYNQYKNNPLVQCHKDPLPHDEYINALLQSKFVLCPTGNGLDSYRILEALYLGAVPIIINGDNEEGWLKPYQNMAMLTKNANVDEIWNLYGKQDFNFDLDNSPADLVYWRNRISEDSQKLKETL